MFTGLHWVDGPWVGRLALAARPRGGDWLESEMTAWHRDGIDTVVSLLEPAEEHALDLVHERDAVEGQGMHFVSIPLADRSVPPSRTAFSRELEKLDRELTGGRNLAVHCRQGVGRTGIVAACLLTGRGIAPVAAVAGLSAARGIVIPETEEQRHWIEEFAEMVVSIR